MATPSKAPWRQELDAEKHRISKWILGDEEEGRLLSADTYVTSVNAQHAGTGEWLWKHGAFDTWYRSRETGCTLSGLMAAAGSGKTVLAASVAKYLKDRGQQSVIFFCSYNDIVRRSSENALRSLALQLLDLTKNIPGQLSDSVQKDVQKGRTKLEGLFATARVVEWLMFSIPRVHIIVDGLDELDAWEKASETWKRLWTAEGISVVKWYVTTRQEQAICAALDEIDAPLLCVPEESIKRDILSFLGEKVSNSLRAASLDGLSLELESNFQWAALLLQYLQRFQYRSSEELNRLVTDFPPGLEDIYLRTLESRLAKQSEEFRERAIKLISFIMAAKQPLRLGELADALELIPNSSSANDWKTTRQKIEDLGPHLIVVKTNESSSGDSIVTFSQRSVYDFFSESGGRSKASPEARHFFVGRKKANELLGRRCLSYLDKSRYDGPGDIEKMLETPKHAFLRYSAVYWYHHLQGVRVDSELNSRIQEFMAKPRFWTCVVVQSRVAPFIFARYDETEGGYTYSTGRNTIAFASRGNTFGVPLPEYVKSLVARCFVRFIAQWHQILNEGRGNIQHCHMGEEWDWQWPAFRQWLSMQKARPTSLLPETDAAYTDVRRRALAKMASRPCLIASQVFSAMLLVPEELEAGHVHAHQCSICSQDNPSYIAEVLSGGLPSDGEYKALESILTGSSKHLIGNKWEPDAPCINIPDGTLPTVFEAVGVLYRQKRSHSNDSSDSDAEDDNGSEAGHPKRNECCMIIYRRGQEPLIHYWSSRSFICVNCASDVSQQWVVWTSDPGTLYMVRRGDDKIQHCELQEPEDAELESADCMFRDVQFSADGTRLWYILCTMHREHVGTLWRLHVSSYDTGQSLHWPLKLHRIAASSVTYRASGVIRYPGILAAWTDGFVFVALPPHARMPKMLRITLIPDASVNDGKLAVETLREPIFFPSTTNFREAQLQCVTLGCTVDYLVLTLAAEAQPLNTVASKFQDNDLFSAKNVRPSLLEDDAICDGARQIIWRVDRTSGWREWDSEKDKQAEAYQDEVEMHNSLRGRFVDSKRRFVVHIRSTLGWRRIATLSCY